MNNLKLTPLEDHLYQIIYGTSPEFLEDNKMYNSITIERINAIKECASVFMKWIEKAFCDAYIIGVHDGSIAEKKHNYNNIGPNYSKENWLKENGLTPTEPDTKEEEA